MIARKLRTRRWIAVAVGAVALVVVALAMAFLLRGRGLGLWRLAHLAQAVVDHQAVLKDSHGQFTNVIFLHHSTGRNLIEQGQVRQRLAEAGYDFWDHDYNHLGLRRPDGSPAGYSYNVPDDNTDPDGLAQIFGQQAHALPRNALSGLLQHEVIIVKSCFPVSNITSDEQLAAYQTYYLDMRAVMDRHPDKVFILLTPPPLGPSATTAGAAARARAFADWLKSDAYLGGHPNVFTFDLFGILAQDDPLSPDQNMLRQEYRRDDADSHPNQLANETVGPQLADFIAEVTRHYRSAHESTDSQ